MKKNLIMLLCETGWAINTDICHAIIVSFSSILLSLRCVAYGDSPRDNGMSSPRISAFFSELHTLLHWNFAFSYTGHGYGHE